MDGTLIALLVVVALVAFVAVLFRRRLVVGLEALGIKLNLEAENAAPEGAQPDPSAAAGASKTTAATGERAVVTDSAHGATIITGDGNRTG